MRTRERGKVETLKLQHQCHCLRQCNKLHRRRHQLNLLPQPISLWLTQTPISATLTKIFAVKANPQIPQMLLREAQVAAGTCVKERWMHIPKSLVRTRHDCSPIIIMLPPLPIAGPRHNKQATIPTSAIATTITAEEMFNPTATPERCQFNGNNNNHPNLLQCKTIQISYPSMILHHLNLLIKLPCHSRSSNSA